MIHEENHKIHRSGWLRAAVLGANDGLVSTASLIAGVAAAEVSQDNIILAGTAGLVAGAISMAAGEYVSVKSQEDTERADLEIELKSLTHHHAEEQQELAEIYENRGLDSELAMEVARQMMNHDALGAHARDDIGITQELCARPLQAAFTSAATFAAGAAIPVTLSVLIPVTAILWIVPSVTILTLGILGALAAKTGGASPLRGALRVCFWGTIAMGLTAAVGRLFGVSV